MPALQIHCVENGPIKTNTYFAVSGGEAVVIDPAWDGVELARRFALMCPGVRVRALVATHGHADHIGGVAGMRRVLGPEVPFLISAADAGVIGPSIAAQRASWDIETEDPCEPDVLLSEGDAVEVGDVRLEVIATPGHTPGGIVLHAQTDEGHVAFVGDTLFPGGHGRTDLPGGDTAEIYRSLAKMARLLPDETLCLIGHGPTTTIGAEREGNLFMRRAIRHNR